MAVLTAAAEFGSFQPLSRDPLLQVQEQCISMWHKELRCRLTNDSGTMSSTLMKKNSILVVERLLSLKSVRCSSAIKLLHAANGIIAHTLGS